MMNRRLKNLMFTAITLVTGMAGIASGGAAETMNLTIGAGKAAIEIPDTFFPTEGFVGVHDKLHVRTLLIDNGATRLGLVVVDMTSLFEEELGRISEIVNREGQVESANLFIAASHNFSSPHIMHGQQIKTEEEKQKNDLLMQALLNAVTASAKEANEKMTPAKIGYGSGISNVNVNRDLLTSEGWGFGSDEQGVSDKEVAVIKFESLEGKPLAILMNYAAQSSIMNESIMENGGKFVTADLAGAAAAYVEQQYRNDIVALFTIGAAGDQAPIMTSNRYGLDASGENIRTDIHDAGYILVELLGERLGSEVVRVSRQIHAVQPSQIALRVVKNSVKCQGQKRPANIADILPTKQYAYEPGDDVETPIEIMQIGTIVLAGVRPELASKIGMEIKQQSPFKNTVVMTMVNGAAKYMADAESYDKFTYEARNSGFAKGSAEIVAEKIIVMLNQLKN